MMLFDLDSCPGFHPSNLPPHGGECRVIRINWPLLQKLAAAEDKTFTVPFTGGITRQCQVYKVERLDKSSFLLHCKMNNAGEDNDCTLSCCDKSLSVNFRPGKQWFQTAHDPQSQKDYLVECFESKLPHCTPYIIPKAD